MLCTVIAIRILDQFSHQAARACDQRFLQGQERQNIRLSIRSRRRVCSHFSGYGHLLTTTCLSYRYDGLYIVDRAYMKDGKSKYRVCAFDFRVSRMYFINVPINYQLITCHNYSVSKANLRFQFVGGQKFDVLRATKALFLLFDYRIRVT